MVLLLLPLSVRMDMASGTIFARRRAVTGCVSVSPFGGRIFEEFKDGGTGPTGIGGEGRGRWT